MDTVMNPKHVAARPTRAPLAKHTQRRQAARLAAQEASKAPSPKPAAVANPDAPEPVLTRFMERWYDWTEDRRKERAKFGLLLNDAGDLVKRMIKPPMPRPRFKREMFKLCADGIWRKRWVTLRHRPNLGGARHTPPRHAYHIPIPGEVQPDRGNSDNAPETGTEPQPVGG